MSSQIDVSIDVTHTGHFDVPVQIAASIYIPKSVQTDQRAIFCFPGGTYSRAYFDLVLPNKNNYSLASYLADSGYIVATFDYIGLGDSTPFDPLDQLSREIVIDVNQAAASALIECLIKGTVTDRIQPIPNLARIGLGHSMGGYFVTYMQAAHRTFDAIALLGWTQFETPDYFVTHGDRWRRFISKIPDPTRPPRSFFHDFFYENDVPPEVIAADKAAAVRIYPWVFHPDKHGIVEDIVVSELAKEIDVPIFLGFGERDISRNPHREPEAYPNSTDLTVFIVPEAAHCTNFSSNRLSLYRRLASWGNSV